MGPRAHGPMGPWGMGPWAMGPWARAGSHFFDFLERPGRPIFSSASKFAARGANRHVIWSRERPNQTILGNPIQSQIQEFHPMLGIPSRVSHPILDIPSNPGLACLAGLGLLGYPSPRSGLARLACTTQQRHRPPSAAGAALRAAVVVAGAGSGAGTRRG